MLWRRNVAFAARRHCCADVGQPLGAASFVRQCSWAAFLATASPAHVPFRQDLPFRRISGLDAPARLNVAENSLLLPLASMLVESSPLLCVERLEFLRRRKSSITALKSLTWKGCAAKASKSRAVDANHLRCEHSLHSSFRLYALVEHTCPQNRDIYFCLIQTLREPKQFPDLSQLSELYVNRVSFYFYVWRQELRHSQR